MMIDCPKCGFSQPEDQYCAKCGVDMVAFRPKDKTYSEKFFGNTWMQFFALGVIIAICFMGYQVARTSRRLGRSSGAQQFQDVMASDEASEGAADMSQRQNMPAPDMPKAARTMAAQVTLPDKEADIADALKAKSNAAPAASASPIAATAKVVDATQLRVVFAEVSKPLLADWFQDAKNPPTSSGNLTTGVIGDFQNKVAASGSGWHLLEQPLDQPIEQSSGAKPIILIYKGGPDTTTGQNVGISIQITVVSLEAGGATFNVSSSRNLHELTPQGPTITEVKFSDQQFKVTKGGAAMFAGMLLHRPLQDEEIRLYNAMSILRVMTDEGYRSGATEFAFFIEPR